MVVFLVLFLLGLLPCFCAIVLAWLIFPKIIPLKQKVPTRKQVLSHTAIGTILYAIIVIVLILLGDSKNVNTQLLATALFISPIASMIITAWLTVRYKDFCFKQTKQTPVLATPISPTVITPQTTQQADEPTPTTDSLIHTEVEQSTTDNPIQTEVETPTAPTPDDHDWQAYKHRMEERWQRTKQSFNQK